MSGITPGPWLVKGCGGGYIIEAPTARVVRGAGGVRTADDAVAIAAIPQVFPVARRLLELLAADLGRLTTAEVLTMGRLKEALEGAEMEDEEATR